MIKVIVSCLYLFSYFLVVLMSHWMVYVLLMFFGPFLCSLYCIYPFIQSMLLSFEVLFYSL